MLKLSQIDFASLKKGIRSPVPDSASDNQYNRKLIEIHKTMCIIIKYPLRCCKVDVG